MHLPRTPGRTGGVIFYAAVLLLALGSARAATFVVTSTADPGDGNCTAANVGDGCTLREAINAANAAGGADTIDASGITGTIALTAALPDLSSDITLLGPGPGLLSVSRIGSATSRFRIFTISSAVTVGLVGVSITGGWTADGVDRDFQKNTSATSGVDGGGIYNAGSLTITRCTVTANQTGKGGAGGYGYGGDGGGVYNTGTLSIIESTISENQTGNGGAGGPGGGGGYPAGAGGSGAGIYSIGTATVVNSTISGNQTGDGNVGPFSSTSFPGLGGGIYGGPLAVTNCTISGNHTGVTPGGPDGRFGGGAGIFSYGGTTISNCTITGNGAENKGGGINRSDTASASSVVTLRSTIVAGNSAPVDGGDIYGAIQSDGYNLIGTQRGVTITPNPGAGPEIFGPAYLDPLADNGGPTKTHLPQSNNAGIDRGKNFSGSNADQRGFTRVVDLPDSTYPNAGDGTDIGAVEYGSAAVPTPTATATATPSATATPNASAAPSATATPTATPTASPLVVRNISTRARIQTGDNTMIAGFIITGTAQKKVVIRGLGPSLQDMNVPGFLGDPVLELRGSNGAVILSNDNWQDDSAQAIEIQAAGLAPTRSEESAIVFTLVPGTYTAILRGKNETTGVGLVEVYDIDNAHSRLANISTRSFVGTGDAVMIGGFTLAGFGNPTRIVVRALGPSLASFGLSDVLEDPTLELHDGNGAVTVANDNWTDDPASAAELAANGLALHSQKESGVFVHNVAPGQFTAIVAGKNGGIGIALVEIYNLE